MDGSAANRRVLPREGAPFGLEQRPGHGLGDGTGLVEAAPELQVAWARHARSVFQRCLALMAGRHDDADEAFSRTSFVAVQKYAAHRGRIQNAHHWLLRLAHNVCMDLHRGRARQARLCEFGPVDSDLIGASHAVDQEAILLREEQFAVLYAAMSRLAPRLRAPLELRLRDELSDRRIAARLQLTETTVRKRLQEARAALRPVLVAYRRGNSAALVLTSESDETSYGRDRDG